jgi:hypothetical protein
VKHRLVLSHDNDVRDFGTTNFILLEAQMFKKLCKSITPLMLLAAVPAMADEPVMSKFKMSVGGYVKLDYAHNSNAIGPISPGAPGGQEPLTSGTAASGAAPTKDESVFTAKQSRIWLKVAGPEFAGAKTNALIEMDFYGTGSLSNEFANMRMRHAYGTIDWPTTQLLFGQFWDMFGISAADTIDFRLGGTTGAPANPRVPQIRLTQKVDLNSDNTIKFALGVQNPVQDSATTGATGVASLSGASATNTSVPIFFTTGGDNSMSRTNSYGSAVNGATQLSFTSKLLGVSPGYMGLGNSPLTFTMFGLAGTQKFIASYGAANASKAANIYGYGAYAFVPLVKSSDGKSRAMTLSLETQGYFAAGLDVQGATALALVGTTQGSNPSMNAAKGYGLYGQLKFYPTQELGITTGYSRRETTNWDKAKNLTGAATATGAANAGFFSAGVGAAGPERYNEQMYVNATYDLNAAVRFGTEFQRIKTRYKDDLQGQNNIVRFAAYYFF